MTIQSYRDLKIWQAGVDLAEEIYRLTGNWPRYELYGLTSQARRAAVSVPANIAEGYGRHTTRSYAHFLKTARGSLKELETHLLIAERVGIVTIKECEFSLNLSDELGRMLNALIRKLDDAQIS